MISIYQESVAVGEAEADCICRAAEHTLQLEGRRGSVDIYLAQPEEIREANAKWRNVNSVTDVLSFPAVEAGLLPGDGFWGELILCPARAKEQAARYGHSLHRELAFLAVHGVLHLLGYGHAESGEELRMQKRQREILERMELLR